MNEFEVPVDYATQLQQSALISNIQTDIDDAEHIPVLFGRDVHHFHAVEGGYDKQNRQHVVTLLHTVQGKGSPPDDPVADVVEMHTPDAFYTFQVRDIIHWDRDYPNESYALTLYANTYKRGKYTFFDELLLDIDKREQEFHYNE